MIAISSVNGQESFKEQFNTSKLDETLKDFNGVVLIANGNNTQFHKAYGFSDFESNTPLRSDDKFLVGSVTKPIVAYLVLKQVEKSLIDLDQPISELLPDFHSEKGKAITVRMLLNHTSGIPHYSGLLPHIESPKKFMGSEISLDNYVDLISKCGLTAIPEKKFHYSSLGYVLLGAILEKSTGMSFAELINTEINDNLNIQNIGYTESELKNNIVPDYKKKKDEFINLPDRHQSNVFTAGGIYANSSGLFEFFYKLKNGNILKPELQKLMFDENATEYSLGWFRNDPEILRYIPSARFFGHGGRVNDYSSYVMLGDDGTTIIMLSNVTPLKPWKIISNVYKQINENTLGRLILPSLKNLSHFNEEDGIEGVINYQKALSKNAGYPVFPSVNYLAKLMKKLGDKLSSNEVDLLVKVMSVRENRDAEAFLNHLGYLYNKIDSEKAKEYFVKATNLFPKSANAWDSLGEFYENNKKYELAKDAYSKAVNLASEYHLANLEQFKTNLKRIEDEL